MGERAMGERSVRERSVGEQAVGERAVVKPRRENIMTEAQGGIIILLMSVFLGLKIGEIIYSSADDKIK